MSSDDKMTFSNPLGEGGEEHEHHHEGHTFREEKAKKEREREKKRQEGKKKKKKKKKKDNSEVWEMEKTVSSRSEQGRSDRLNKVRTQVEFTYEDLKQVQLTFERMDKNDDGEVSREELREELERENEEAKQKGLETEVLTEELIDHILRQLDTDGSGQISAEEFLAHQKERVENLRKLYNEIENTYDQYTTCRQLFFFLTFTFLYFQVLAMQMRVNDTHQVESGLREALSDIKADDDKTTFLHLEDPGGFWHWISTGLVPEVYKVQKYNEETMAPYEKNYLAAYNRVIGGMFIKQTRGVRVNAANDYSAFYPVEYTLEPDTADFGPLYTPDTERNRAGELPDFDERRAFIENSGIPDLENLCDVFENVPLRDEFCVGQCKVKNSGVDSLNQGNSQCQECRSMCVQHFIDEDITDKASPDISRVCTACRDYFTDDGSRYSASSFHFHIGQDIGLHAGLNGEAGTMCEEYRRACAEQACVPCLELGPPVRFDTSQPSCLAILPICDAYLYEQRRLTCSESVFPETGGCAPQSIGDGVCDLAGGEGASGCNTQACGWDAGDCCAYNLERSGEPTCDRASIGDGACNDECWNEYCLADGGDCTFCTSDCMKPISSDACDACREDCTSEACTGTISEPGVCPGFSACTGACDTCPLERQCIAESIVPDHRVDDVAAFSQCYPQMIGNGVCDEECYTASCSLDGGDCGDCPAECVLRQGDGECDEQCYHDCPGEVPDCPSCNDGCPPFMVGDGTCNPECFNVGCQFDSGDCYYCGSDCVGKMGDGHCDSQCYIGACELDGGDCNVCNSETGCLNSLVNNGVCDKQCFNFECNFDGQDCYHCDRRPECSDRFVGDGVCDYDCYHEDCGWDEGDCETVCKTSEYGICKDYMTLDDTCQRECYYEECGWDGDAENLGGGEWSERSGEGPCQPECAEDCQTHMVGDRQCDRACFNAACQYDSGDCDVCAPGCPWSWVHDGQCDPECYNEACFMDGDEGDVSGVGSDCSAGSLCSTGCTPFMVGDGACDANCTSAACGFDGGDCGQFCDSEQNCPISWVNNGACDVACFESSTCERDGMDCNFSPRCSRGCVDYVMLANARCEPACNTTECGFDYGDCGVEVPNSFIGQSCFPGYVFDCDIECVAVTGIKNGVCNNATSTDGNFDCPAFFNDFGDCEVQSCPDASVPSVSDCDGACAPISAVGDDTCNDGTAANNFNCEAFFYDMGDCAQPEVATVEAALELGFSANESAAIMDESSPARAAFETNFVLDLGRSLGVPSGSVRITGIFQVGTEGRRRLEGDETGFTPYVPLVDIHPSRRSLQDRPSRGRDPPAEPEVVSLVVEFEIEFENPASAQAVVEDIAVQAADPNSPMRTANVTGAVTRAETVRLDEPQSWVADLNEALVAASCDGQQLEVTLTYGNVAWSLTRFPESSPSQSGTLDVAGEVFCVSEGVYVMTLEPSSATDACCTGDWTVKIKDAPQVLADGNDFQTMSTVVFVVGSADLAPACEEPPCGDVHSMAGYTCQPLWIGSNSSSLPVLNQGCAPHPTLGETVGVGWCKVQTPAAGAYSGCNDPASGGGCGEYLWDYCEVPDGLAFQSVQANQGELIASISPGAFTYFLFDAVQGAPYTLFTTGYGLGDSVLYLYDTDGTTQLAMNDDWNGLMSQISWDCPSTGTYVVAVRGYSSSDSGLFALTVDVVVPPNPCDPDPCMNDGVCVDLTFGFSCDCTEDYGGTTCSMPNLDGVDFAEVTLCPSAYAHEVSDVGVISDGPGDYANNQDCGLHIETAEGTAVALSFSSFSLESNFDYVYVYDGDSSSAQQLARYDGYDIPPTVMTSGGNHMFVRMQTDGSVTMAGFDAVWSTVDPANLPPPPPASPCQGGVSLTGGGIIDFTGGYENGQDCRWILSCPGTMTLDFLTFQTEGNFDYVYVHDGESNSASTLLSTSGWSVPAQVASSGSSLLVEFTSDYSVTNDGFSASWTCAELGDPCDGGMSLSGGFAIDFEGTAEGTNCAWTLSCAVGPVYLSFQSLEAGAGNPVQLYDGELSQQMGGDITGTDLPEQQISTSSTMIVQTSGSSTFMADFQCNPPPDPCSPGGADLTGTSDIVLTNYGDGESCSWNIECGSGPVTLTFSSFSTEGNFDYVYVDNDISTQGQGNLGTLHGSATPAPITSAGSTMSILFTSDGSVTNDGFTAVASCPPPPDPCASTVNLLGSSAIDFSQGYDNSADCSWNVQCDSGPVSLTFQSFQTEGNFDYVYVNGESFHGSSVPAPMSFDIPSVDIQFTSDGSVVGEGFSLVVDCPAAGDTGGGLGGGNACNGGAILHGNSEIDFSTPETGSAFTCSWDMQCVQPPVQLAFEFFATQEDVDIGYVIDGDTDTEGAPTLAALTGTLPFGTIATEPWIQTSSGSSLGLELSLTGLQPADFRATVQCPNDAHVEPPSPPVGDPCVGSHGGQIVTSSGPISLLGYSDGQDCSWAIQCDSGPVTLTFQSFETEANFDFVLVDGQAYSGSSVPDPIQSVGSSMSVQFTSDGSITADGFTADVACPPPPPPTPPPPPGNPCVHPGVTLTSSGTIDFTGGYDNSQSCHWDIQCDSGAVALTFTAFQTEGGWDYVIVDGVSYHGGTLPDPIDSDSSSMSIQFTSDGSVTGDGFAAEVACGGSGRRRQQDFEHRRQQTIRRLQAGNASAGNWSGPSDVIDDVNICASGKRCAFRYDENQEGFIFLIPLDFSEEAVELNVATLMEYLWVDSRTREVELKFATYNGNEKLFSMVRIEMKFGLTGRVKRQIQVDTVNLELHSTAADTLRTTLEQVVLLFVLFTGFGEVQDLCSMGLGYFSSFWNYIDIANILLFLVCYTEWMFVQLTVGQVEIKNKFDMSTDEDRDALFNVMGLLDDTVALYGWYIVLAAMNVMVIFVRFFKYLKVQERLQIVNETLALASVDLIHFLVSFGLSFYMFAVMASLLFGYKMEEFRSVTMSLHTLFEMAVMGSTDTWPQMREMYPIFGVVFQYTFYFFVGMTMVNITLAIIMDSYAEVMAEARREGSHTIADDFHKARGVLSVSPWKMILSRRFLASGTPVDYKGAKKAARLPPVKRIVSAAKKHTEFDSTVTLDTIENEVDEDMMDFLQKAYARRADGVPDDVDKTDQTLEAVRVDLNHRMNELQEEMNKNMAEIKALLGASNDGE